MFSWMYAGLLKDWPNVFVTPKRRQTFWTTEGNLIIDSEVFRATGGFDPALREHEIQDLAIRINDEMELPRFFDPSIVTRHKNGQVRGGSTKRLKADRHARKRIAAKHQNKRTS